MEASERHQVFEEDVVCLGDDASELGIVTQLGWQQDEDDGEGDDHDDGEHKLEPNQVRVSWTSAIRGEGKESANTLRVVDRSFLHADLVAKANDPTAQFGVVTDVRILVDVEYNTETTPVELRAIPSHLVRMPHSFFPGKYVVADGQLGVVEDCICDVEIVFPDGGRCTIESAVPDTLMPLDQSVAVEPRSCDYWHGQEVRGRLPVWKKAKWINGTIESAKSFKGVGRISNVMPSSVVVEWVSGRDPNMLQDNYVCTPSQLTLLNFYEHTRYQIGDHVLLDASVRAHYESATATAATASALSPSAPPTSTSSELKEEKASTPATATADDGKTKKTTQSCAIIKRTSTVVDVQWQDGTVTLNMPSISLIPRAFLLDNDYVPQDFVVRKDDTDEYKRCGVIQSINSEQRTANIMWLPFAWVPEAKTTADAAITATTTTNAVKGRVTATLKGMVPSSSSASSTSPPSSSSSNTEQKAATHTPQTVPVSPPRDDSKREGVTSSSPASSLAVIPAAPLTSSLGMQHGTSQFAAAPVLTGTTMEDNVSIYSLDPHPEWGFRVAGIVVSLPGHGMDGAQENDWAGQIVAMHNGYIQVRWASGNRSWMTPAQLYPVDDEDEAVDDEDAEGDEEGDDDYEDDGEEGDVEGDDGDDIPANELNADGEVDDVPVPPPAQSRVAAKKPKREVVIPSARGAPVVASPSPSTSTPSSSSTTETVVSTPASSASSLPAIDSPAVAPSPATSTPSTMEEKKTPVSELGVPSFEMASTMVTHQFRDRVDSNGKKLVGAATRLPGRLLAVMNRELKTLSTAELPSLYIRAAEDRLDLLSFAIIGAPATPYFNGIFTFDLGIPNDYPASPPQCFYHAYGYRLNPNLYVDGKVCLSLLNTWSGKGTQKWDPTASSLLQVVLSIQGLVLGTNEPYYLEAGYDQHRGSARGAASSLQYNEMALLFSLQQMIATIAQPPSLYTTLVQRHFARARSSLVLLSRCTFPSPSSVSSSVSSPVPTTTAAATTASDVSSPAVPVATPPVPSSSSTTAAASTVTVDHNHGIVDPLSLEQSAKVLALYGLRTTTTTTAVSSSTSSPSSDSTTTCVSLGFISQFRKIMTKLVAVLPPPPSS